MTKTQEQIQKIRTEILDRVSAERARQISGEGFSPEMDDLGDPGRLAAAGACYSIHAAYALFHGSTDALVGTPEWWPFSKEWWKPKDSMENLIKAMALILAEAEKLARSQEEPTTSAEAAS